MKKTKAQMVPGKVKPHIKSGSLRVKESDEKVRRQFAMIRKIPGHENDTKTEVLMNAYRIFQSSSLQNGTSLFYFLVRTFLAPLRHSIGTHMPVALLREEFFGIIELANPGIADHLRKLSDGFDWFAFARISELQAVAQQGGWGINLLELFDNHADRSTVCKVTLKNGRTFICDNAGIPCVEPHIGFPGDQSLLLNHSQAIGDFVKGPATGPIDLRFSLSSRDTVLQPTLFNVVRPDDGDIPVEVLMGSGIALHLEGKKLA
jgi:hypothetical protein